MERGAHHRCAHRLLREEQGLGHRALAHAEQSAARARGPRRVPEVGSSGTPGRSSSAPARGRPPREWLPAGSRGRSSRPSGSRSSATSPPSAGSTAPRMPGSGAGERRDEVRGSSDFLSLDPAADERMRAAVDEAKAAKDSLGGTFEVRALGLPRAGELRQRAGAPDGPDRRGALLHPRHQGGRVRDRLRSGRAPRERGPRRDRAPRGTGTTPSPGSRTAPGASRGG